MKERGVLIRSRFFFLNFRFRPLPEAKPGALPSDSVVLLGSVDAVNVDPTELIFSAPNR